MRIERIEASKHKQERILVFLEGGRLLRVTENELLHFGLHPGLDIDPRVVVELEQAGTRSETRVRAAELVSARPMSKSALAKKLRSVFTHTQTILTESSTPARTHSIALIPTDEREKIELCACGISLTMFIHCRPKN